MSRPYLISLVGHAGSGKSYFARALAEQKGYVRLNGDSLRTAMYGSVESIKEVKKIDPSLVREKVFKALDYAAGQILDAETSVIYDANNNKRSIRMHKTELARAHSAIPIVVWIKLSKELAIERSQSRDESVDQRKMTAEQAKETVERHIENFDEPSADEHVIVIDGTLPSEVQLSIFASEIAGIHDK